MEQETILGLGIERAGETVAQGAVAYYLHGPRATYRLVRQANRPGSLFVLNSKGNVCGIKGNYHFSDRGGSLRATS